MNYGYHFMNSTVNGSWEGGANMANLQVKGMDDALYNQLKMLAAAENRSVSQEIIHLTDQGQPGRTQGVAGNAYPGGDPSPTCRFMGR